MMILDLFCGAGGAAMGYHRAGFSVIGVDLHPQKNYPFAFVQMDVFDYLACADLNEFDAIHASPPCQALSTQTADKSKHVNLIPQTREALVASGLPYVIENVEGAGKEMRDPARLCGSSFGLDVRRHRLFETNWNLVAPPCDHSWQTPRFRSLSIKNFRKGKLATVVGVHGHLNYPGEQAIRERAMQIDWMTVAELAQSIPPAYTEFIGRQLAERIRSKSHPVTPVTEGTE
jgi:DNA (cytosine-5)-methyltransferase 1